MEIVYNKDTHYSDEIDIDKHEEREDDSGYESTTSYEAKSTTSASTAGQSMVTFAQMAMRQAYVITKTNNALTHHTESVAEPTKEDSPTQLSMLELARKKEAKKVAKKSSLQAAAIQGAIDRRAARAKDDTEEPQPPILGPHPRDAAGRLIAKKATNIPSQLSNEARGEELKCRAMAALQRRNSAPPSTAGNASKERIKQMELQMKKMQQLIEENARLNSVIQQLTVNQGMIGALVPATGPRIFG
jgi:hypothetical protein